MRIALFGVVCLAVAAGCDTASSPPASSSDAAGKRSAPAKLPRIKLGLNWYPEAEHGGYYAALVHGYFRQQGLDVEIVKGGPAAPIIPQVAAGQLDFGISNADGLLLGRAQDAPVVALMAPLQTSPRCIMVHASSGIDSFHELQDITIAISSSQPFYHFLRKHAKLERVTIVPYQGSVAQFLVDRNFAQQAYIFSEPFVARQQGGDPKSLLVAELGFNPYTSVLFATQSTIDGRPNLVRKIVAASVRGWQKYLAEPEATNRYIHRINPEMTLEALAYGAETLGPLAREKTGGKAADRWRLGSMSLDRWRELAGQLQEIELLAPGAVRAQDAFTLEFLPHSETAPSPAATR